MGRLNGRTALVTGAASGLGRAAAVALQREGANVFATDVDEEGLKSLPEGIKTAVQDVVDEARWDEVFDEAHKAFGTVHVLVNNAGIGIGGATAEFSLDDWRKQMTVNTDSVFLGTRAALRQIGEESGSIINISSVAGLRGAAGLAAYCASKGAVRLFSKAVALECAGLGQKVRVNSIHPGIIDTPIWTKNITGVFDASADPDAMRQAAGRPGANAIDPEMLASASTPMMRAGRPEEIADMIVFLASEESSYVTGQELVVDGGMTAR